MGTIFMIDAKMENKTKLILPGIGSLHAALTMLGLTMAMGNPAPSVSKRFSASALNGVQWVSS